MKTHEQSVHDQFDPQAQAYLTSAVHAAGPDLARARHLVGQVAAADDVGLDVGCGAGHLSFALASVLSRVVALDPSEGMLATVLEAAAGKGLANVYTQHGAAELLPFADASFDLVATRYSAHHWGGLDRAMREIRRVVRPGGHVLVIDTEGAASALVDTHLQAMELLRDRSHVRNRSESEWREQFRAVGIELLEYASWPTRLEFASWVARMRTPPATIATIRTLQREAPMEVRDALAIEADGSFTLQTGLYWGRLDPQAGRHAAW
jgi:ubiquinone/menaquinone biosynthesis C-methylase UbiE